MSTYEIKRQYDAKLAQLRADYLAKKAAIQRELDEAKTDYAAKRAAILKEVEAEIQAERDENASIMREARESLARSGIIPSALG